MAMMTRRNHLLIVVLFLTSAFATASELPEAEGDHHEHGSLTDVTSSAEGHAHGDSDDHHESPGDDCHHHVMHCCCGHSHAASTMTLAGLSDTPNCTRLAIPLHFSASTAFTTELLHVPIA